MNDGRDAEDARLLDSGEHARLLATYEPVIVGRCVAGLRGALAVDPTWTRSSSGLRADLRISGTVMCSSRPRGETRGTMSDVKFRELIRLLEEDG